MPGNSFGQLFKITTCGESHGEAIGVVIDGCPAGMALSCQDIQGELNRRKPGQSHLTSPRQEKDQVQLLSGVYEGRTTGTPILLLVFNHDAKQEDYQALQHVYRPSHADYTYHMKYGLRDFRGGGRASARETLARVAAGAVAKKYLREKLNIEIFSYVEQVGLLKTTLDHEQVQANMVEANTLRCPDPTMAPVMIDYIEHVKQLGDTVGGVIRGVIRNVPVGLGEPVFDKLPADLAKAMLSINAAKGFDMGSGFAGVGLLGSEHNDPMHCHDGQVVFASNQAGGTLGGISTGQCLYFRVAFKPVATIAKAQSTVTTDRQHTTLSARGRHDPCVLPRAVPIVDAMAALVIMDHYLRFKTYSTD